jgi:MFS family permease
MLLFGIGGGLVFAPTVALAMSGTTPADSGVASGLANLTLQLGAALGLAVLASVSASVTSHLIGTGTAAPNALTSGFHVAFLIGAGCQVVSLLLAVTLLPRMATRAVQRGPQPSVEAA